MGQNDSKPTLDCKHQQSLLKGYRPLPQFNLHHLSNDLQVFIDTHSNHLCINKFELDWRSAEALYDTNTYYRQRMRLNTHNLINIYHTDIIAMGRNESIRQHLQQFGTLPQQTKVNVNTSCSLNIFEQNCQKNIIAPKISPQQLQLHLYQQYLNTNLEAEAQSRKKTNHKYSQKQLWTILASAVSAGYELISKGFKEPLLSPVAIKLDNNGNMFFGEWEFSHFFEDQNEVDEDTHFFEEGEAYLRDTSRLSDQAGKGCRQNYNILTNYYWAPEGTAAMQNAVTLGKLKKPSLNSITTSRLHTLANSQIFSLGMTLLHLILLKPLYQQETYSEKKINNYLEQAVRLRIKQNSPLSKEFIALIAKMLRWSPEDRISYDELQEEVHSNSHSRTRTVFSMFTSEIKQSDSKINEVKTFPFAKDAEGSGSVNQGSGDIDHPQQQQALSKPGLLTIRKADCNVDYGKVDFTIKRQRREWQKFENRLLQSEYKITAHRDYNPKMVCSAICSYTNNSSKQNSALSFPAEILIADEEDTPAEENLCKTEPREDSAENIDQNTEGGDAGEVGLSRISDSIKILDISNIKAGMDDSINRHNQSKESVLNFNAALEQSEQSFTKMIREKKSQNINTSDSDSLLLKSSVAPQFQYPTIATSKDDNLFTPPQFLDFIRTECMRQSKYSQAKANEQQNELQTSIEAELTNSTFVKQSFAKGCYEGGKVDGLRNGYGTFYYNEGGKYCGDWQNNQMHGKGTLYYSDGRIAYQGEWRFDSLNGKGILYNQNPVQLDRPYDYRSFNQSEEYWAYYEGSFHQDDKWGNGTLFLSNGEKFEGCFKNDLIDGKGVFSTIEGGKVFGEWSNNKLVRVISQSPCAGSQS